MTNKKKKTKSIVLVKPAELSLSPEVLISQAIKKGATVDTLERLLAMRNQLKKEKAEEAYHTAMAEFQAECPIIKKKKRVNNKDGSKRYSYAPLESIVEQVKPLIQKYGFSYTIDAKVETEWVEAICKVVHKFGHNESGSFKIPIDTEAYMSQPQKFAAALTFAKRYAFCDAFGILTGDDDNDAQDDTQIDNEKKPLKLSDKPTIATTISGIRTSEDITALNKANKAIQGSDNYTETQKRTLLSAIEERLKELKNEK